MEIWGALALTFAVFVLATAACGLVLLGLRQWRVLDTPNSRSSHKRAVPRGGGLGFVVVILAAWAVLWWRGSDYITLTVLAGAALLAAVSFVDDLVPISYRVRLVVQAAAIALALTLFPYAGNIVSDALPWWLDRAIAGFLWLWFVNLFNFMDGIDGIAASEAAVVAAGLIAVAAFAPELQLPATAAMIVAAAALGFLLFNWSPARVFMGDVGSTSLGFLLGWLLLITAAKGALPVALILPLAFALDATSTLAIRAWRGARLPEAHRDHAYQRAVDGGWSHTAVVAAFVLAGIFLTAAAIAAAKGFAIGALSAALVLTALLLLALRRRLS